MDTKSTHSSEALKPSYLPHFTANQKCALATIALSVALIAIGSFALAGVYSPSSAFASIGDPFGEIGSYIMLAIGTLSLMALAIVVYVKNRSRAPKEKTDVESHPALIKTTPAKSTTVDTRSELSLLSTEERGEQFLDAALTLQMLLAQELLASGEISKAVKDDVLLRAASGNLESVIALLLDTSDEETRGLALINAAKMGQNKALSALTQGTIAIKARGQAVITAVQGAIEMSNTATGFTESEWLQTADDEYSKTLHILLSQGISGEDRQTATALITQERFPLIFAELQKVS